MEANKKKEDLQKWTDLLLDQENASEFILANIIHWEDFPLSMKIQSLEQFGIMIDSSSPDEDVVLQSSINFFSQIRHNNPRIVKQTLQNLIAYTKKTTTINYNVPHVVNSLISKVMIRKEFREKTIELILLIFSKCKDGLNIGIQEIFSQSAPKPICEALFVFELLVAKQAKETIMKEFIRQYVPQIFEYTSFQYPEVRSAALKLFITLIKEYGEAFLAPYKSRLKSNQIEFINKNMQKEHVPIKNQKVEKKEDKQEKVIEKNDKLRDQQDKQNEKQISIDRAGLLDLSHASKLTSFSKGGSLNVSSASSYKAVLPISEKIPQNQPKLQNYLRKNHQQLQKPGPLSVSSKSQEQKKESFLSSNMKKEKSFNGNNDVSKTRSSFNSTVQKKKLSDTTNTIENDSSSELSRISEVVIPEKRQQRELSFDIESQKKAVLQKVTKVNLSEILEKSAAQPKPNKNIIQKEKKGKIEKKETQVLATAPRKKSFQSIHLADDKLSCQIKMKFEFDSSKILPKKQEEISSSESNKSKTSFQARKPKSQAFLASFKKSSVKKQLKDGKPGDQKEIKKDDDNKNTNLIQMEQVQNQATPHGIDGNEMYGKVNQKYLQMEECNEDRDQAEGGDTSLGLDNKGFCDFPNYSGSDSEQSQRSDSSSDSNSDEYQPGPTPQGIDAEVFYVMPFLQEETPSGRDNEACYAKPNEIILKDEKMKEDEITLRGDDSIIETPEGKDNQSCYIKPNLDRLKDNQENEINQAEKDIKEAEKDIKCENIQNVNDNNLLKESVKNYQPVGDNVQEQKVQVAQADNDAGLDSKDFKSFQSGLVKQNDAKLEQGAFEVRGYFFKQDIEEILSEVSEAENAGYFFPKVISNQNDKEVGKQDKKKALNDEDKIYANSIVNQNQVRCVQNGPLNEQLLQAFLSLSPNKLIQKLTQEQKDQIIYTTNKDQVNQWFNKEKYDNVAVISFFIFYIGQQFAKQDPLFLSRFWNFQKFLTFNNALIQEQTIRVMHIYFKTLQKHAHLLKRVKHKILRDTIVRLIKIIPVSRDKLFDTAFAFVDYIFELDSYSDQIFDAISEVLQSNVPKQTVASLRILSNFLRLYGGKRLKYLHQFMNIVKSISFSANLQVRNAAIEFYQEAYTWMGDGIFEYTKQLKKSQLFQLEKAFSQMNLKEKRPLKCPEDIFTPIMDNHLYQAEENIFQNQCDEQTQKLEDFIRKALAVQEWVNKDDLVERIVKDAITDSRLKQEHYVDLVKILQELLDDWNKYLIENTLSLIYSLALNLKSEFASVSFQLFERIFELYSSSKTINRDKITKTLIQLFVSAGLSLLLPVLGRLIKKGRLMKELLNIIRYGIKKNSNKEDILVLVRDLQVFLKDKDSYVKVAAFDIFGKIRLLYGAQFIEENIETELKSRFILQKISQSSAKIEKIQELSSLKKQSEKSKNLNHTFSRNSEMSTASIDRQYFYVQLQNCKSPKNIHPPIQQFKILKKNEMRLKGSGLSQDSLISSQDKSLQIFDQFEKPEIDEI